MLRFGFPTALCVALGLVLASPQPQHAQAPKGTIAPKPVDPGRPWGWAVKASLDRPNDKLYNRAKQRLLEGKQVFGHSIRSFDIAAYCEQAPHFDFTWFEMQHSLMTFAEVQKMIEACPRAGAAPMIRLPDAFESTMQKATDIGMLGVIIPTVDDGPEARDAARWMRYPPAARRSSGNTGPSGTMARMWDPLAPPGLDYRKSINDNMLMVVMIETVEGVENALEIATTPGVDVVIMGNNDLQQFSGIPITDDRYQDMLTHVRDATYLAGKFWGNAGPRLPKGNVLAPDSRFHQNGPAFDGWVDPKGSPDAGAMPQ